MLVGVGASLTQLPAVTSPPYTESATFQIVALPSGVSSYDGYLAQSRAETAANVASDLVTSSNVGAASYAIAIVQSGAMVTLTVHAAAKADAERVLVAALAAITTEVANGDTTAGGSGSDAQLRVQVTSALEGAVVDRAAQQASWRGIIERLALALVVGMALAVAAALWEGRRGRGTTQEARVEAAPDRESDA